LIKLISILSGERTRWWITISGRSDWYFRQGKVPVKEQGNVEIWTLDLKKNKGP
jgi:hypothetical protein